MSSTLREPTITYIEYISYGLKAAKTLPRPLLLKLVGLPGGLGQDPPLGNEDDVLAGELLLELADEASLDLLEGLQLRNRHEDDDGLLALHFDLLGSGDVQLSELAFQVGVDLQIEEGLRDRLLELVGLLVVSLDDLGACGERHLREEQTKNKSR